MRYFIEAVRDKYFTFTGRATREEFWFFILFSFLVPALVWLVLFLITFIFGFDTTTLPVISYDIINMVIIIPSLSIAVRRLHDINRTGWWLFLLLLPVIGWIWLFIFYCQKTVDTNNRFKNNPKDNTGLIRKAFTSHYINFSGRASRAETWASYFAFCIVLYVISSPIQYYTEGYNIPDGFFYLCLFLMIAIIVLSLIPLFAVTVRRLHDSDRSGWFVLLDFIPIIGNIALIILLLQKSTEGKNRFGEL